jgi:hypothetical protein
LSKNIDDQEEEEGEDEMTEEFKDGAFNDDHEDENVKDEESEIV